MFDLSLATFAFEQHAFTTQKGTTHGLEEYYSHSWPGPEVFQVYSRAGFRAISNHYSLVKPGTGNLTNINYKIVN